ncbi:SUMF1/EgtB/PvdO family nonheme iron enzyme, partial [Myxococcota bacterium]|nr:SUMF1/EgtB/PvdO family nonheme iron enzyme [Myxococcota bacterium]MBU1897056.1 SUMF1/EgtB/PvdO family nonheme iron enzyme [Myxococcota bacterium]
PPDAAPLPDALARPDVCFRGEEICNGVDDDCDGLIDEDDPDLRQRLFDDPDHCGACDNACGPYAQATPACLGGRCYLSACHEGFYDYNAVVEDGCESDCLITANGVEICDGLDNNCDGQVDEGFDLQSDIAHCGACGAACAEVERGAAGCVEGRCGISACDPGWVDLDGDPATGCEYACAPTTSGATAEQCNGRDDDCDGLIDEVEDLRLPEGLCPEAGVCGPECQIDEDCAINEVCEGEICLLSDGGPTGVECVDDQGCAALHPGYACLSGVDGAACAPRRRGPVCDGAAGFRCLPGPRFQPFSEAGRCDGLDNDCDGRVDEDFALALATPCEAGRGVCRRSAMPRCAPGGEGVLCEVTPGAPEGPDDDCDGRDDDCDGLIDEDYTPAWVELEGYAIFAYEASRPGATAEAPGWDLVPDDEVTAYIQDHACSEPGVLPWADVSWAQAAAACEALGARLCSGAEWAAACGGAYPYGEIYAAPLCNGGGRDDAPGSPGLQDALLPCGALESCARGGVYDLSGNLKEWVDEEIDGLRPARGGGFETNPPEGLRCDLSLDLKAPGFTSHAIGFRCCLTH